MLLDNEFSHSAENITSSSPPHENRNVGKYDKKIITFIGINNIHRYF